VQITGSHNPAHHNGVKLVWQGGRSLARRSRIWAARRRRLASGMGTVREVAVIDAYVDRLLQGLDGIDRASLADLAMAWDAGNGAAGPVLERLVGRLPGRHQVLFAEVDGTFPNHHPDPTVEANLPTCAGWWRKTGWISA
jgi:phosphomannomutase